MKAHHLIFCLTVLFFSCNEDQQKLAQKEGTTKKPEVGERSSILELDERLQHADSLVFVFYKDPHGKDSLRYTRYYTQYSTTDAALIHFVQDNLKDSTQRLEKIKNCHSEGKIWCFAKSEVFQTIYFSAHNNECNFVYIIKNGQFYYSDIGSGLSKKLTELKPKSTELLNLGQ